MIFTSRQRSYRKVMFSLVSVCLFTDRGRGVPRLPLPVMHWTSLYSPNPTPWTWDLTVQGPPYPLLVAFGGHHWTPVQICSLQNPPQWCWHLVMIIEACMVAASGHYASYWNAFLCFQWFFDMFVHCFTSPVEEMAKDLMTHFLLAKLFLKDFSYVMGNGQKRDFVVNKFHFCAI